MSGPRDGCPRRRERNLGGLLVQALMALTIGLMALTALGTALRGALRWSRYQSERAEGLEVARTVWVVLDEELRRGRFGRDWILEGSTVLSLRAFRGVATVCAGSTAGSAITMYRGERNPDPARDSILALGSDGEWRPLGLRAAVAADRPTGCGPDAAVPLRFELEGPEGPDPILLRLFERGSYHLEDGAFRYRRGAGGRQPLTPERLGEGSRFDLVDGALEVTLEVLRGSAMEGEGEEVAKFQWRTGEGWGGRS